MQKAKDFLPIKTLMSAVSNSKYKLRSQPANQHRSSSSSLTPSSSTQTATATIMSGDEFTLPEARISFRTDGVKLPCKPSDKIFDGLNCKSSAGIVMRAFRLRRRKTSTSLLLYSCCSGLNRDCSLKPPNGVSSSGVPGERSRHRHPSSPHFKPHAAPSLSVSSLRQ